jgi:exodeoxyribonuclease-5
MQKLPNLSNEQRISVNGILNNFKQGKKQITFSGPAGSGKTTVISHLVKILPDWKVCAFTGKAASVLRKKGVPATTIHKLIYIPDVDDNGNIKLDDWGNPVFILAPHLDCGGIIVDEASMVSGELYNDLRSFGLPILYVGDHNQLEPIGAQINLMKHPDFILQHIHRNAGEVARFCDFIRNGYRPAAFQSSFENKVHFITRWQADEYLTEVDQVLCAFNRTRVQLNRRIREKLGRIGDNPVVGDRIMCLKNNNKIGLFNGMQGEIEFLYTSKNRMHFKTDDHTFDIIFTASCFNEEKYEFDTNRSAPNPFDYCNCITIHKGQGSEWDKIMVFEQRSANFDHRRLCYTAASRAQEEIFWVTI